MVTQVYPPTFQGCEYLFLNNILSFFLQTSSIYTNVFKSTCPHFGDQILLTSPHQVRRKMNSLIAKSFFLVSTAHPPNQVLLINTYWQNSIFIGQNHPLVAPLINHFVNPIHCPHLSIHLGVLPGKLKAPWHILMFHGWWSLWTAF